MAKKSKSKLFNCILEKVCKKEITEPFRAIDFDCLSKSRAFLAKHSVDENKPNKKIYGNAYFEREKRGLYIIKNEYLNC